MQNNDAIGAVIIHKPDHNARYFDANNTSLDFLVSHSLITILKFNSNSMNDITDDVIQTSVLVVFMMTKENLLLYVD